MNAHEREAEASALDAADPLRGLRDRFVGRPVELTVEIRRHNIEALEQSLAHGLNVTSFHIGRGLGQMRIGIGVDKVATEAW